MGFSLSLRYHQDTFYVVITQVMRNTHIYKAKDTHGQWQEKDWPAES
ncbi:MAG: hypothetical protein JW837_05010 [Sedimentisphaerales bacterium]|nr:hypothetical protein [Sedimentisphaerales bacterium]